MCGRYTLPSTDGLQQRFELVEGSESGRGRLLRPVRWGVQPVWVREDARRPPPINARAEGVATNALFRDALARRRCLVVADGF